MTSRPPADAVVGSRYRLESADHAPGLPTIVDVATGQSILARLGDTPVFADLETAERVLAALNGTPHVPSRPCDAMVPEQSLPSVLNGLAAYCDLPAGHAGRHVSDLRSYDGGIVTWPDPETGSPQ